MYKLYNYALGLVVIGHKYKYWSVATSPHIMRDAMRLLAGNGGWTVGDEEDRDLKCGEYVCDFDNIEELLTKHPEIFI